MALEFLTITEANALDFEVDKFRGLSVAPAMASWPAYHAGSLVAAAALGTILLWPPAQALITQEDPVSCTVKFTDSTVSEATCTVADDTLAETLDAIGIDLEP